MVSVSNHLKGCLIQLVVFLGLSIVLLHPQQRRLDVVNVGTTCKTVDATTTTTTTTTGVQNDDVSISMIVIASLQRSSSTFLSKEVLGTMPCHVSLDEIFLHGRSHSGDAWRKEGKEMGIDKLKPSQIDTSQLVAFVEKVGRRRCREKLSSLQLQPHNTTTNKSQCHNHCWVNYKHFSSYPLAPWQAPLIWDKLSQQVPFSMIILERNVYDRWRSLSYAYTSKDWVATPNDTHKENVAAAQVGPIPERLKFSHQEWYKMVRGYAKVQMNKDNNRPVMDLSYGHVTKNPVHITQQLIQDNIMSVQTSNSNGHPTWEMDGLLQ